MTKAAESKTIDELIEKLVKGRSADKIGLNFKMVLANIKHISTDEEEYLESSKIINDALVKGCKDHMRCCGQPVNARHGIDPDSHHFIVIKCGHCGDTHEYTEGYAHNFHIDGKTGVWTRVIDGKVIDTGKLRLPRKKAVV
jgi:hypothetical protein